MILISTLIGNWDKLTVSTHTNLAVFMFLFMICAIEVVLLKMTTTSTTLFGQPNDMDFDDSSEYEEDIYYEDLRNNYQQWARRRMRLRQRQQRHEQHLMQHFRQQQQQPQQQH